MGHLLQMVSSFNFYAPAMTRTGALRATPVHMSHQQRPFSKLNSFDPNVIRLGHIVYYYNVIFKFNKGPYHTMPSGVIALCY